MAAKSAFAALIHDGLFDPSPKESAVRVKDAVAKELEALDSTTSVRRTEYFNHTFAPDLILTWPDSQTRHVFLRMAYDPQALVDDVALIDSADPLIFGLTEHESISAKPLLDEVVSQRGAMFTEPAAIERLIDRKKSDSTTTMLSNALAQGGRGSFVGNDAVDLAEVVHHGFESAVEAEGEGTAKAVTALEARLHGQQAWRMNRVLQAVWVGSSGSISAFPGDVDVSGHLNTESLTYLLKYMRTDDKDFWRRVGRGLTLGDLESLDFAEANVAHLIQANLDLISARATVVKPDPLGLNVTSQSSGYRWAKRNGHVTLEAPSFFALVGSAKTDLADAVEGSVAPVSVDTFMRRVRETDLVEVSLRSGSEHVTFKSDEGAIYKDRLHGVSDTFGGSTEVVQAIVGSRTGRVTIDLPECSGTGKTQSKVRMADLLLTTVPLVLDLDDEDRVAIAEFLTYEAEPQQQELALYSSDEEAGVRVARANSAEAKIGAPTEDPDPQETPPGQPDQTSDAAEQTE